MTQLKQFKIIVVSAAVVAIIGLLLIGSSFYFAQERKLRDRAMPARGVGVVLIAAAAIGGGVGAWKTRQAWQKKMDEANEALDANGVTLALAPRSITLPDNQIVGLWRRLAAILKRQSEWPEPHIAMEVVGNRDRIVILMRIPAPMKRAIVTEISREFPGTEVVEFPSSEDQIPKGTPNVYVDPAFEALAKGYSLKWESLKLAGKPAYPMYESLTREDQMVALLGAVSNVSPTAYVGFQFLIRQSPANVGQQWMKAAASLQPKPKAGQPRPQIPQETKDLMKAIANRAQEPIYEVVIRAWAASANPDDLDQELRRTADALLAETLGKNNRLVTDQASEDADAITKRQFPGKVPVWLTATELNSFLHMPAKTVASAYEKLMTASAKRMPPAPGIVVKEGEESKRRIYGRYHHPTGDVDLVGQPFPNTQTHLFFIGPTGSGKSVTLANNVRSDFMDGKAGVLVIEPSGDVPGEILKGIPPEYHNDVVILNPRSRQPFALNMCAIGTELGLSSAVDIVTSSMRTAMGAGWDQAIRMQQLIVNGLYVVMDVLNQPGEEGASMLALAQFLQDPAYRESLLARTTLDAGAAADFWLLDFANWPDKDVEAAVSTAMRRVGKWLGNPTVRRTLGLPYTTIDLAEMLGGPLNASGPAPKLVMLPLHVRMGQEVKSLMGGLFINYYTATMLLRDVIEREHRRRAALHVDEFKNFVSDTGDGVETLLAECRKYAASVNLYTQGAAQISGSIMTEIKINCLTKGYFRLSDPSEARLASSQMGGSVDVYDLQRLPPYHAYMQLAIPGGQAPPAMIQMLPPKEYDGEQPQIKKGFAGQPHSEWKDLITETLPFGPYMKKHQAGKIEIPPNSLQDVTSSEFLRWIQQAEKSGSSDELVLKVADLSADDFNALRQTRAEFDAWRVAELKANPGLIQNPMQRVVKRSEWEYGIPAWETDAVYLRSKAREAAPSESGGASYSSTDFDW